MFGDLRVTVMIPALDEEANIGRVVSELPRDLVDEVVVVDNGSRDLTVHQARRAGAVVLYEPRRGYGWALLRAMARHGRDGVVVFMDGDGADDPADLPTLLAPLGHGVDLVVGTRAAARSEEASTTWPQRFGNRLVVALIERLVGYRYQDLGPFRAVRAEVLRALKMKHATYGWTAEMQIKAVTRGFTVAEVPVRHRRRRAGTSKVSGNTRAVIKAGLVMPATVAQLAIEERLRGLRRP